MTLNAGDMLVADRESREAQFCEGRNHWPGQRVRRQVKLMRLARKSVSTTVLHECLAPCVIDR